MWWQKPKIGQPSTPAAFPFMRIRWVGFLVTLAIFVGTTVSLVTQGLNFGLDFTGGVLIEAERGQPFEVGQVRSQLAGAGFEDTSVATAEGGRIVVIRLPTAEEGQSVEAMSRQAIAALGPGIEIRKTDVVGPKVSDELLRTGIIAALLSVLVIAVYVWFRFESKFGVSAFLTTFHDVYAVVGLFSITQMTFDLTTVAAALTVAGYSINDTVVVFDRIREMLKKYKRIPLPEVIDISITSTLTRTFLTSTSVLLACGSMMLLGGPVLFGFAAGIGFGVIVGTYSSVFVAAPMLMYLPGRMPGGPRAMSAEDAPAAAT
jgi:preprotein translocase subunit SecF